MSLAIKTAIGVFWNLIENFSRRGIQVLVTLLLAYFLTPEDFGLVSMLAVFIALGTSLMDSGFKQALIRLKGARQIDFDTAFYSNIVLGIVSYILLFVSAPYIAEFYDEPRLVELVRVVAFVIVINSLYVVQVAKLSRDLNFKAQLKANVPAAFISGIGAVVLAYFEFGVWALIAQMLLYAFFVTPSLGPINDDNFPIKKEEIPNGKIFKRININKRKEPSKKYIIFFFNLYNFSFF